MKDRLQTTAIVLAVFLFVYEYIVWQVDTPYTNHGHLVEKMGRNSFFFVVQLNTIPHLIGAISIYNRNILFLVLYLLYISLFTLGQLYNWWLPYFFNCCGLWYTSREKMDEYFVYHHDAHRILPQIRDHPVIPSTEHTILFPFSIITLGCCVTLIWRVLLGYIASRQKPRTVGTKTLVTPKTSATKTQTTTTKSKKS